MKRLLGGAIVLVVLVAACGGGDDGDGGTGAAAADLPECLDLGDLYALVGPESQGFGSWSDADGLGREVQAGHVPYPDASLDVYGPGEESGTYDSFVELALEEMAEERGQEPQTRPDYQSNPNDNVIVQGVQGSSSSLGWVGFAFYADKRQELSAFQIDGGEGCVVPNEQTISGGDYPLARDLFIYVNEEKARENPAVAAFVDLYLSDEGMQRVSDAGYVQLADADLAETRATWEESGLGGPDGEISGDVAVSGSSTVEPITARVAEAFTGQHDGVDISVEGPGTGDGFQRFCAGETDISDASRPIEEDEADACAEAGIEYVELKIGIDGITVITAPRS